MLKRKYFKSVLLVTFLAFLGFNALCGDQSAAILRKVFTDEPEQIKQYFAAAFLKAVPEARLIPIVEQYRNKLGTFQYAQKQSTVKYKLIFEKGTAPSSIQLNGNGLIVSFWLGNISLRDDSFKKVKDDIEKLKGQVSFLIIKNNKEIVFEYNPDLPLGVGSAFKLFVLKALQKKVESNNATWQNTVELKDLFKSLPSGILQTWPNSTPLTLKSLANLMISMSDNTATDTLIHYLGRQNVEAVTPKRVRPFLTTLEMFKLKWGVSKETQKKYLDGSLEQKRQILKEIEKVKRSKINFNNMPTLVDRVEWFLTVKELCNVIYDLKDNNSLIINPGLATPENWRLIGYKGGSEPGVLNYTHLLKSKKNNDIYCISATINNTKSQVPTDKFTELNVRLISLLNR